MSELYKAIVDFKQRKKFEYDMAFGEFESVLNSTHTIAELSEAARDYDRASAACMAVTELLVELVHKGLI